MKLEVGKKYRTYGGKEIKVIHIADEPLMSSYKVIAVRGEYEIPVTYSIDGIWCDKDDSENNIKEEM